MAANPQPITLLVGALGGEGGGVLAEWLYALAARSGHPAQSTSIPGVAQRTGATTYYVEICPLPAAALGGRRPVFSLNPVPGGIDLLVGSELLETARQVGNGMASAERTTVIGSTSRALTVAEKMQPGDGRADSAALAAALRRHARELHLLDVAALARQANCAVSALLFGAIAASGVLPFARAAFEETVRAGGKGVDSSLRGFALAFDAIAARRAVMQAAAPAPLPDLRVLARERVAGWQDEAYAKLFDERLARIEGAAGREAATEAARWLGLWMAFDDIVQVARLKLAATRAARVRREVGARDDEIVRTYEHFKPGVPEIAGLLPAALAQRLQAWDRRRAEPWSLPLRLGSHGVRGALALRLLASLKGWRRRGSRFAAEQALIEQWVAAVERGGREDPALGLELARCGRLVKGYGSTNERGKANLLHITGAVASAARPAAERAAAVAAAREAALADDAGLALDRMLAAQALPKRPMREQPVRWYRRRPNAQQQQEPSA